MESRPIIALIGRPNVGKSTIFNRLIGRRQAIVSPEAGTTRDRHFGVTYWFGHSWTIVDTAGILFEDEQSLEKQALQEAMEEQVAVAVEEANLIAMVVDVKAGIHPDDERLMQLLRKQDKPVVVLANKADNQQFRLDAAVFERLGVDRIFPVAAIHGTGVSDFIDYLIEHLSYKESDAAPALPRVTIIGRPNVGKSTLINQLLGEERLVVSEIPGTTRDAIAEEVTLPSGQQFVFIDTAGIRRRGKIEPGIEKFSLFRTLKAINRSDIVVMVLTIEEAPARGDAHVAMYAMEANKKLMLVLNKADLAREDILHMNAHKQHNIGQRFLRRFPFLQRLPYVFVSAQTGQGMDVFLTELEKMVAAENRGPS